MNLTVCPDDSLIVQPTGSPCDSDEPRCQLGNLNSARLAAPSLTWVNDLRPDRDLNAGPTAIKKSFHSR
jgi:hypothetical protein